jgi:hypothetical protein
MSEPRRFLEVGHVHERTTKTGNPYLTGMIAGQQVFLFPQEDGSWKVFIREDEPHVPTAARAPDRPADQKAYEQTLAGVDVPDYDEPLRRPLRRTSPVVPKRSGGRLERSSGRRTADPIGSFFCLM